MGIVIALAASRLMSGFLYGVEAIDPLTYVTVAGVLVFATLLASWIPARRAARVDPATVLASE